MAKTKFQIKWLKEPEDEDYEAALSFLTLNYKKNAAKALVDKLRRASLSEFEAKDIFRTSHLSLLGVSNSHVQKDQEKIRSGKRLSPILLVRDPRNSGVIIADGYHRLCAVYTYDEDALIPCKIV